MSGIRRKEKKVVFNGFGFKEGFLQPKEISNCNIMGGSLRGGVGYLPYCTSEGSQMSYRGVPTVVDVQTLEIEKDGAVNTEVYFVGLDGYLYYRRSDGSCSKGERVGKGLRHSVMKMENGDVYHFLSASNGVFYTLDGIFLKSLSTESRGSCVCGMRFMYALKNGEVHYFAPLKPYAEEEEESNGAGVIFLPAGNGDVVGMREFDGSAYVFLEKGIYRLTPASDARDFTMTKVEYSGGTICWGSMIATGKGVLFLAENGMYILRNNRAERFCEHISVFSYDSTYLCSVGRCEELVLLEFREDVNGVKKQRRLAVDVEKEDGFFIPMNGTLSDDAPTAIFGYLYTYAKSGELIRRFEAPNFVSVRSDFGTEKVKRLKKIRFRGEGRVTFCVHCEDTAWAYDITMENSFAEARVLGRGKEFYFTLYPGTSRIDDMEITYLEEE